MSLTSYLPLSSVASSLSLLTSPRAYRSVCALLTISLLAACNSTTPTHTTSNTPLTLEDGAQQTVPTNDEVKLPASSDGEGVKDQDQANHINDDAKKTKNNNDLWQKIRDGYQLPTQGISSLGQSKTNSFINNYRKHPNSLRRQTNRASLYLYHVVTELEKHSMPTELALLPFVESGYDPFAYSSGRASGLWQFIPGTGKRFKLERNWWLDERRDVVESTEAAIKYFTYLHKLFDGDWLLAIAAYNAGEGTVGKAIRKNKAQGKPTDYWSLPLPKETRFYIPKLLAWKSLVKQPEKYSIQLTTIENAPYFSSINVGSQIDLAKLADISKLEIKDLYALNPSYNHWATDPDAPHNILIPQNKAKQVKQALAKYPVKQRVQWQRYTIKSGDSLSRIANHFNTPVSVIKKINHIYGSRIRAGKVLLIPKAEAAADFYSDSVASRLRQKQDNSGTQDTKKIIHTVASGDSLWSIGQRYKVKHSKVAKWNNMAPADVLSLNQKLVLWLPKGTNNASTNTLTKSSPSHQTTVRKVNYQVKTGDSLSSIANRFSVSIRNIKKWNPAANNKYLKPGQALKLFVTVANRG